MHLETLRLYCDVVRLRSFSRGAELSHVSQSAASQAVQQLERDVGVTLIDRTRRPFAVTPAGQSFYAASREMIESARSWGGYDMIPTSASSFTTASTTLWGCRHSSWTLTLGCSDMKR